MRLCLETFHCQSLKDGPEGWGKTHAAVAGGQRWVNGFGSDRRLHRGNGRFELTKFESICLWKQQRQPWLLDSIIFHIIPRVCVVMECIQWVAWRTSSFWTFVSLSWCLHAFGRSKSSDATQRAEESTEFDSTLQGKHSFETSSSSYTKKVSVPGRSCWWKEHRRIHTNLAGIPSVWAWKDGKWYELWKQQRQPWLLDSIIFHTIPRVCVVMECIQWVAWRTSSVWTFVSLSWCLHAFGRSKSSDATQRAKETTEFDSTL